MTTLIIGVLVFAALQFINVILQTMKSVIMVKYDSPHINAVANAIAFGFYAAVVKSMTSYDYVVVVIVTVITNLIGVYVSYKILAAAKRDNLWIVEVYTGNYSEEFEEGLNRVVLGKVIPLSHAKLSNGLYRVYCYNQEQSAQVRDLVKKYNMPYNVTEITRKL